ncbi:MFS transporter, partial [Isoptericola cucumis]|uniref:MFS transporter n=1 Tax=Isoptericola cucumis TaxID=1776856 RepID=UPI003208AD49
PPARVRDVAVPVLRGDRGLGTVVQVRALMSAAFVGAEVLVPLALVRERGLSPALAGAVLTLHVLGWSAGSWLRGRGVAALSHAAYLRLGGVSLTLGIAGIALVTLPGLPLPVAATPWVLAGLGMGLSYPTLNLLALELAPGGGQGTAMSAMQVADAAAATLALSGTGALLWTLHDRIGLAAYAVCLAGAAVLALTAAVRAGRTAPAVTKSLARPSSLREAGDESAAAPASL